MASSRLLILSCSILLFLLHLFAVTTTTAQDTAALFHVCSDNQGNFTAKSTYQSNLNQLLTSLSSSSSSSNTKIDSGFFNVTNGKNLNQVNAMGLCRGDVKPDSCRSCITAAALELPKACPNQKEAFIWYDDCMFRYSNRFFFGSMEFGPWFWMYNLNNVSNADSFNQAVGNLLDGLKSKAAASSSGGGGGSVRKFATGNAKTPDSRTIYALVQCTPDLSKQSCIDCLNNATDLLPKCCNGRKGGRVIAPSCNFRYEMDRFYDVTADSPMASPSPSPATSPLPPTTTPTLTPTATSPAQSPASQDESPPPAGPPPTTAPVQPPPSQGESPTTSPPGPPQPTAQTPESQDQSPPPGPPQPTAQTPESQDQSPPPPPPPSNSAIQKGKTGHSTFATSVSLLVPLLLLWNY